MQESKLCDGMLNVVASLWRWKLAASQAGLAEMAIIRAPVVDRWIDWAIDKTLTKFPSYTRWSASFVIRRLRLRVSRCPRQSLQLNVQSNRWATRRHVNIHQCRQTAALICLSARLVGRFLRGIRWSLISDWQSELWMPNNHRSIIERFHFSHVNFPGYVLSFMAY